MMLCPLLRLHCLPYKYLQRLHVHFLRTAVIPTLNFILVAFVVYHDFIYIHVHLISYIFRTNIGIMSALITLKTHDMYYRMLICNGDDVCCMCKLYPLARPSTPLLSLSLSFLSFPSFPFSSKSVNSTSPPEPVNFGRPFLFLLSCDSPIVYTPHIASWGIHHF